MTAWCSVVLSGLLVVMMVPGSMCGPQARVERSLPDLHTPFNDLLSAVRPFTNETSGSFIKHVTAVVTAFKQSVSAKLEQRGKQLFAGATPACLSCQVVTKVLFHYIRTVHDIQLGVKSVIAICRRLVFKQDGVCEGIINGDASVLEFIVRHSNASPEQLCQLLFTARLMPAPLRCGPLFKGDEWAVDIPPPIHVQTEKQLATKMASEWDASARLLPVSAVPDPRVKRRSNINGGRPYLKMLHLTDLHYDPNYQAGSNAKCAALLCCQKDSGNPSSPATAAGKWGDYRLCDSPERLVRNLLDHLRTNHPDIDYILYSGDSVPHDIWRQSKKENNLILSKVEEFLSEYFPSTPIVGALGNHESHPRDSYPPPEDPKVDIKFSNQELYNAAADYWQRHLPNVTISEEARITGSYSALLRPGLRVISINTNFCIKINLWVLYKNNDPGNVLRWLAQELLKAEEQGERVQIVGHVAPLNSDCYEQWAHQFSRIVTRFSKTIQGQFYGHSHLMQVMIHYHVENPNLPIGVQYLTPSNTPFYRYNPTYTLFYIDGDHPESTRAVLDTETFFMNLTAANNHGDVRWLPLYSAKKDLSLDALEARDWEGLVHRMNKDPGLTKKFRRYQVSASDARKHDCDRKCRRKIVCSMVDGDKFLPAKCRRK